jgi:hypothetical protein
LAAAAVAVPLQSLEEETVWWPTTRTSEVIDAGKQPERTTPEIRRDATGAADVGLAEVEPIEGARLLVRTTCVMPLPVRVLLLMELLSLRSARALVAVLERGAAEPKFVTITSVVVAAFSNCRTRLESGAFGGNSRGDSRRSRCNALHPAAGAIVKYESQTGAGVVVVGASAI